MAVHFEARLAASRRVPTRPRSLQLLHARRFSSLSLLSQPRFLSSLLPLSFSIYLIDFSFTFFLPSLASHSPLLRSFLTAQRSTCPASVQHSSAPRPSTFDPHDSTSYIPLHSPGRRCCRFCFSNLIGILPSRLHYDLASISTHVVWKPNETLGHVSQPSTGALIYPHAVQPNRPSSLVLQPECLLLNVALWSSLYVWWHGISGRNFRPAHEA